MNRTPLITAAALTAGQGGDGDRQAGSAAATPLAGTVGPGFTITLTKGGKAVKTLKHGQYTITVQDKATIHDFHLTGPGVDKVITSVSFKGTKSVTVTLKKGTYIYQCDPHARSGMKATFKVT